MTLILIRSILLFVLIMVSVRLMGKRQIAELQPGELVVTIMISNLAVLSIEDTGIPTLTGIIPILILVCFEVLISNIGIRSKKFRKFISGNPVVVIENGKINQKALKDLRFTLDDLAKSLRSNNIFDISEVSYAIVETNGNLSVMKKFGCETVTADMLDLKGKTPDVPLIVISDGKIVSENIERLNIKSSWIEDYVKSKKMDIQDVFLMTSDKNKKVFFTKREEEK